MSAANWRRTLGRQVAQIQQLEDAQLKSLPASSRFLLAPTLRAAAAGYAAAAATRKWLYRQGLLRPTGLPCPVLSIGNLTAGGTGKTPFVEYLARHYMRVQRLPAMVLQMGRGTVDEALMLRDTFQNDPVVVAESTTSTGQAREYLRSNPDVRLVLLDDGLQALPLSRDLEIVMVNALSPFGNGHLLPRGTLRELPRAALRRADAVFLHHVDLAGEERTDEVQRQLALMAPRHALFMRTQMAPVGLRSLLPRAPSLDMSEPAGPKEEVPLSALKGAAVVCLVAVGMPQTVEAHLRSLGVTHVEGCGAHPDHHSFTLEEVQAAVARAQELGATSGSRHAALVMTEKDYARQSALFDAVFAQLAGSAGGSGPSRRPDDGGGGSGWGAYVLHSALEVVQHDRRFSSAGVGLNALLRMAVTNFRMRSYSSY